MLEETMPRPLRHRLQDDELRKVQETSGLSERQKTDMIEQALRPTLGTGGARDYKRLEDLPPKTFSFQTGSGENITRQQAEVAQEDFRYSVSSASAPPPLVVWRRFQRTEDVGEENAALISGQKFENGADWAGKVLYFSLRGLADENRAREMQQEMQRQMAGQTGEGPVLGELIRQTGSTGAALIGASGLGGHEKGLALRRLDEKLRSIKVLASADGTWLGTPEEASAHNEQQGRGIAKECAEKWGVPAEWTVLDAQKLERESLSRRLDLWASWLQTVANEPERLQAGARELLANEPKAMEEVQLLIASGDMAAIALHAKNELDSKRALLLVHEKEGRDELSKYQLRLSQNLDKPDLASLDSAALLISHIALGMTARLIAALASKQEPIAMTFEADRRSETTEFNPLSGTVRAQATILVHGGPASDDAAEQEAFSLWLGDWMGRHHAGLEVGPLQRTADGWQVTIAKQVPAGQASEASFECFVPKEAYSEEAMLIHRTGVGAATLPEDYVGEAPPLRPMRTEMERTPVDWWNYRVSQTMAPPRNNYSVRPWVSLLEAPGSARDMRQFDRLLDVAKMLGISPIMSPYQVIDILGQLNSQDAEKSRRATENIVGAALGGGPEHKIYAEVLKTSENMMDAIAKSGVQVWKEEKTESGHKKLEIDFSPPTSPLRTVVPESAFNMTLYNVTALAGQYSREWMLRQSEDGYKKLWVSADIGFGMIWSNQKLYENLMLMPFDRSSLSMRIWGKDPSMDVINANIPVVKTRVQLNYFMENPKKGITFFGNVHAWPIPLAALNAVMGDGVGSALRREQGVAAWLPTAEAEAEVYKTVKMGLYSLQLGGQVGANVSAMDISHAGAKVRFLTPNPLLQSVEVGYSYDKPLRGGMNDWNAALQGDVELPGSKQFLQDIHYTLSGGAGRTPYSGELTGHAELTLSVVGFIPTKFINRLIVDNQ